MSMFKDIITNRFTVLVCRILIGALFIYASISKIFHPVSFAATFINYNVAPEFIAPLVAVFIPWFEFVFGCMLVLGFRTQTAALGIALLLMGFLVGIGINLARGVQMDCGCFEFFGWRENLDIFTFLRDIVFIALTIPPLISEKHFLAVDVLFRNEGR
ncbi:MAG: DoxX family membrane protein [Spirochaetes bacterium]|nr:DoxX family membrane protein [Spirochaetota bacterium]